MADCIRQICFALLLGLVFIVSFFGQNSFARANPLYASIVIDAQTGSVLSQRYADKVLHPASLTKVMTLLMMFEALQNGKIRMGERMYVSKHAQSMVPSKIGLEAGSSIKVRDAISALATKSANDVAVVVAEHLAGSEANFAQQMTVRARKLGMSRTRFRNASGLHDKRQVSTARDMSKLARYVISNYKHYYRFFGQASFDYQGVTYKNHNRLMKTYEGMDGMKTGYIGASGYNLISSAVRGNKRIIGVVFGGKTGKRRNAHMANLLDRGFAKVGIVRFAKASVSVPLPIKRPSVNHLDVAAASTSPSASASVATPSADSALVASTKSDPVAANRLAVASIASQRVGSRPVDHDAQGDNVMGRVVRLEQGSSDEAELLEASWAIQVGAYQNKRRSMRALRKAVKQLPDYYRRGQAKVVPLNVAGRDIYRARLAGYSAHDAFAACAYIEDCITISP